MLFKSDKDVNDATRPPKGGPAEAEGFSALNLPLIFDIPPAQMPDDLAKAGWASVMVLRLFRLPYNLLMLALCKFFLS